MAYYVLDAETLPVWAPLEQVARISAIDPGLPAIEPRDFMYMAQMRARGRPPIHLYKHIETRRYLNLDDGGHAYVYVQEERDDDLGRYEPMPGLCAAICRVLLLGRWPARSSERVAQR